jgi:hypothetical protein
LRSILSSSCTVFCPLRSVCPPLAQ